MKGPDWTETENEFLFKKIWAAATEFSQETENFNPCSSALAME